MRFDRVIRRRIRRSGEWGELAADIQAVVAANVNGSSEPVTSGKPRPETTQATRGESRKTTSEGGSHG
jgi:hypothetical protein